MLNEDTQWLKDMAEAFNRAIKYDSVKLGFSGVEGDHVIQISNELALTIASRMRSIAKHIEEISIIENSPEVRGNLLARANKTTGPCPSNDSITNPPSSAPPPPARSEGGILTKEG
jgi:hypothetical protein